MPGIAANGESRSRRGLRACGLAGLRACLLACLLTGAEDRGPAGCGRKLGHAFPIWMRSWAIRRISRDTQDQLQDVLYTHGAAKHPPATVQWHGSRSRPNTPLRHQAHCHCDGTAPLEGVLLLTWRPSAPGPVLTRPFTLQPCRVRVVEQSASLPA